MAGQTIQSRFPNEGISGDGYATVTFIMKVYHDFRQTMVPPNVWGVFQALGLDFDMRGEPHQLLFNEEKLGESAGHRE
jgi:hypothetical protein